MCSTAIPMSINVLFKKDLLCEELSVDVNAFAVDGTAERESDHLGDVWFLNIT